MPPLTIIGRADPSDAAHLPLYLARVPAGHPAPVGLDLDALVRLADLLAVSASSYLVRVEGASMTGAGIDPGDTLVVDRDAEPRDGQIVIAEVDGELTVKRVERRGRRLFLVPSNDDFEAIEVRPGMAFAVWGVVAFVLRDVRRP